VTSSRFLINCFQIYLFRFMAGPNEKKKETVRIDLPPAIAEEPPDQDIKPRETVRIQLPVREPPSISTPLPGPIAPPPATPGSGLNKETMRLPLVPDPPASAAQMKKTPPFVAMPYVPPQNPSTVVAPAEKNPLLLLLWIMLGVSALILIIQIWTYFS